MTLTHQRVRKVLHYDPKTGIFKWVDGDRAGYLHPNGYIYIKVDQRRYLAHRLAWFWMKGEWPSMLDHKDRRRSNNRWSNLRPADSTRNSQNKSIRRSKLSSSFKGVYWKKDKSKWLSMITVDQRQIHLGYFDNEREAAAAYRNAATKHFGEFASS